jgi:hypothetical protein
VQLKPLPYGVGRSENLTIGATVDGVYNNLPDYAKIVDFYFYDYDTSTGGETPITSIP